MVLRPHRRPLRHTGRTRVLGVAAATATVAMVTGEVVRIRARRRRSAAAAEALPGPRERIEILVAGHRAGTANETAVLNLFVSFGSTFAVARAVTHAIRRGVGPWRNVRIGRRHIHHFVPGILLALVSGALSLGLRHEGLDQWLAVPFGIGSALIIDETALLIELSDVYWSDQGVLSIDVGLGATTALACLALLVRVVRRGEATVHASDLGTAQDPRGATVGR